MTDKNAKWIDKCHKLFPSLQIEHPEPHGWIQWKGTSACMDVYCECGASTHLDGHYFYHIKCGVCGKVYECDGHIRLHPLDFEPEHTVTTEGPEVDALLVESWIEGK